MRFSSMEEIRLFNILSSYIWIYAKNLKKNIDS